MMAFMKSDDQFPKGSPTVMARPHFARGGSKRVLVIDDRRDALLINQMLLQQLGHEVAIASNGEEGVERARSFAPDIVLCDLTMPGMNGFEVARRLRAEPSTAELRLVAVSGHSVDEFDNLALAAGFDEQVVKPLDVSTIERLLGS